MSLRVKSAAKTDIGLVRKTNQDSFALDDALGLYVVCDGMGGAAGGEVASGLATQTFMATARQELMLPGGSGNVEWIRNAVLRATLAANRAVRMRAEYDARYRGMGTTLVSAQVTGDHLTLVNVGDSRGYLVRGGTAHQLTADHSYVAESVRLGMMTPLEASTSSMQSVITRAIGVEEDVMPDLFEEPLQEGDAFLLTTDGLTRHVPDTEIARILSTPHQSAMEGCRLLIEEAKATGGSDNITCLVVQFAAAGDEMRSGFVLRS
ncbi:MAG: protein phosphatase 2C domain-containing protein [Acidobacteriaceae bacterium]|nr:protein phosphatase 2C domain-containing protein [Acidobacteriaceae bacterium]